MSNCVREIGYVYNKSVFGPTGNIFLPLSSVCDFVLVSDRIYIHFLFCLYIIVNWVGRFMLPCIKTFLFRLKRLYFRYSRNRKRCCCVIILREMVGFPLIITEQTVIPALCNDHVFDEFRCKVVIVYTSSSS